MNVNAYNYNRKHFALRDFQDMGDSALLSSPIMTGANKHDGIGLLHHSFLKPESRATISINADEAYVGLEVDYNTVHRSKKQYALPEKARLAQFYDFRVTCGNMGHFITHLKINSFKKDDVIVATAFLEVPEYAMVQLAEYQKLNQDPIDKNRFQFDYFDSGKFRPVFKDFLAQEVNELPMVNNSTYCFEVTLKRSSS
jgi:hypothetical protein